MTYPLWVDCVTDLIDARARARWPAGRRCSACSLGGLLAYQAAARSRKPVGPRRDDARRSARARGAPGLRAHPLLGTAGLWLLDKLAPITDGLPLPMAFMSRMHHISNKPRAVARSSRRDRLGGGNWVPARFLRTLMTTAPAIEPEDFHVCPVLLAHPGVDRMTDIALSRRFFDRLAAPKRMVVLEGASHMPTEHPGVDQLEAAVLDYMTVIEQSAPRVAN